MRSFIRTRYGCDHCKKVGGSAHHMRKHEAGCTNNPNRVCSMHRFVSEDDSAPSMDELKAALADGGYPKLVEVSHNCPACKLAALRQSWVAPDPGEPWPQEPQDGRQSFDYRDEVKAMWSDYRDVERDSGPTYYGGGF